jgi:hypothetical protein
MATSAEDRDRAEERLPDKEPFEEPQLTYVRPTLVEFGNVTELTQQFFGTFYP